MKYYHRRWDEDRGDSHADWGGSEWWFEVEDDGTVLRQIEIYDRGPIKRYSTENAEDSDGRMAAIPLELAEFAPFETMRDEFEMSWEKGSGNR
jgi:hypothetical protein